MKLDTLTFYYDDEEVLSYAYLSTIDQWKLNWKGDEKITEQIICVVLPIMNEIANICIEMPKDYWINANDSDREVAIENLSDYFPDLNGIDAEKLMVVATSKYI